MRLPRGTEVAVGLGDHARSRSRIGAREAARTRAAQKAKARLILLPSVGLSGLPAFAQTHGAAGYELGEPFQRLVAWHGRDVEELFQRHAVVDAAQ